MGHFSAEKTRGDGYWIMDAAAPNDNHYSHAEIVYIISIAPSWHPNISSEPFAAGRPRPRALPALRPCLYRAPAEWVFCMGITLRKNWLEDASFATITTV